LDRMSPGLRPRDRASRDQRRPAIQARPPLDRDARLTAPPDQVLGSVGEIGSLPGGGA